MSKELYIIRGTGLVLDGTIVEVLSTVGDYSVVSHPSSESEVENTMVKTKCLQPLGQNPKVKYTIEVLKSYPEGGFYERTPIGEIIDIDNCIRDVSVETILDFIKANLTPILRMED
jgi:hypothetical protein